MVEIKQIVQQIQKKERPFSLRNCSFSSSDKLMILAPHPDDFDAISVTLKYFQDNGNQMLLLVLTGASSGVDDAFLTNPTQENKEKIREKEQKKALEYFGLPSQHVRFLYLPEDDHGDLKLDDVCRLKIQQNFEAFDPDMIFLPYGEDTNPSHKITFSLAREIAKKQNRPIVAFYNQDPKTIQIRLDAYLGFDQETALWKRKMLRFHQSQQTRNLETRGVGFDDRILNMNKALAKKINIKNEYAEGFQIELFDRPTAKGRCQPEEQARESGRA